MAKSNLYIIFSIIFMVTSVMIIVWIIQQESGEKEIKQKSSIILNEENRDKKNISNQANISDSDKKDVGTALSDIDSLVDLVEKTELPE